MQLNDKVQHVYLVGAKSLGAYKDIIEKYNRESHESTSKIENGTVWVLWWQGIDKAPDIVKICIQSIRKNIGNRNLVILDESNFRDYTNLNPKYENLLNAGAISKTQFSDLLRLNLLYNRGGVWLDSTYLLTGELPSCISDLHFFTIRHGMNRRNVLLFPIVQIQSDRG